MIWRRRLKRKSQWLLQGRRVSMFGWLKKDPKAKLQKAYEAKLTEAMNRQRNGDIRGYSALTAEAEAIKAQIDQQAKS